MKLVILLGIEGRTEFGTFLSISFISPVMSSLDPSSAVRRHVRSDFCFLGHRRITVEVVMR